LREQRNSYLNLAAAGKTIEEHEVPSIISSNDPSNIEVRLKFAVAVEFAALVFGFCPSISFTSL
jgi:hypothetical protein